jgi:GNAT superfamily N-acetyltransferase
MAAGPQTTSRQMSSTLIRPARVQDARQAIEVLRASIARLCTLDHQDDPETLEQWLHNKTTEHFERWLSAPGALVLVAEVDAVIRGVGMVHDGGEVRLCYVCPGFERIGLGRAILEAAERWAEACGLRMLRLQSSATARGFYERLGYVSAGNPTQGFGITRGYPYTKNLAVGRPASRLTPSIRPFSSDEWALYKSLRLAALADAPNAFGSTLAAEQGRPDGEWSARLASGAGSGYDRPLVAQIGARAIGLAWGKIEPSKPELAHVYQMWVAPTCRRQGVGQLLLDDLTGWARAMGAQHLCLGVTCGDSSAMRLYLRVGFRCIGPSGPLRPGSALMAQPMRLELNARGSD